ncbi:MAG: hypothetical protein CR994_07085 [Maribacter sp.]|nr:MAG: hypothetical protein CR994_07085 [Maribacter sp.]
MGLDQGLIHTVPKKHILGKIRPFDFKYRRDGFLFSIWSNLVIGISHQIHQLARITEQRISKQRNQQALYQLKGHYFNFITKNRIKHPYFMN